MRALKVAVALMGVLIVVGTTTLIVLLVTRVATTAAPADILLDEPEGTRIQAASAGSDRLVVQLAWRRAGSRDHRGPQVRAPDRQGQSGQVAWRMEARLNS